MMVLTWCSPPFITTIEKLTNNREERQVDPILFPFAFILFAFILLSECMNLEAQ